MNTMIKDERIGTLKKFPMVDINGNAYSRPCSTIGLGGGYIVAINGSFDSEVIDELKTLIDKSVNAKEKQKGIKQDVRAKDKKP